MVDYDFAIDTEKIADNLEDGLSAVENLISEMEAEGEEMNMGKMFSMQVTMNKFSQLAQVSTDVVAAVNSTMMSMAKNVR